jgi:hypothetical protein
MLTGERFMGRETKILLALLATLAGVFLGVLSMKLLVPRPPVGAGPDVHVDIASTGENELVEPPSLSPPSPGPAAVEPAFVEANPPPPPRYAESESVTEPGDLLPPPMPLAATSVAVPTALPTTAMTDASGPVSPPHTAAAAPRRDPFVAPTGFEIEHPQSPPPQNMSPTDSLPAAVVYVANPGDSWWDLSERAYGDGRLYRALFAWNRVIDPRVSLAPGTRLEIPPRSRLEAAWPKLMPTE